MRLYEYNVMAFTTISDITICLTAWVVWLPRSGQSTHTRHITRAVDCPKSSMELYKYYKPCTDAICSFGRIIASNVSNLNSGHHDDIIFIFYITDGRVFRTCRTMWTFSFRAIIKYVNCLFYILLRRAGLISSDGRFEVTLFPVFFTNGRRIRLHSYVHAYDSSLDFFKCKCFQFKISGRWTGKKKKLIKNRYVSRASIYVKDLVCT